VASSAGEVGRGRKRARYPPSPAIDKSAWHGGVNGAAAKWGQRSWKAFKALCASALVTILNAERLEADEDEYSASSDMTTAAGAAATAAHDQRGPFSSPPLARRAANFSSPSATSHGMKLALTGAADDSAVTVRKRIEKVAQMNSPVLEGMPRVTTPEIEQVRRKVSLRIARDVLDAVRLVFQRIVASTGEAVAYAQFFNDGPDSKQYLRAIADLREVDPSLLSESEKVAFFLNIYNALLIHGIAALGAPGSMLERMKMYAAVAYDIGGRIYTLNDIEHGILRRGRPAPSGLAVTTFNGDFDARNACRVARMDARVHFALNCGARSCPPIRFYQLEVLDQQLDLATRNYIVQNGGVEVDADRSTVRLSRIFAWYASDFASEIPLPHPSYPALASTARSRGITEALISPRASAESHEGSEKSGPGASNDGNLSHELLTGVLAWVERHLTAEQRQEWDAVLNGARPASVEFMPYSWALNSAGHSSTP